MTHEKIKILIVDDDPVLLEIYCDLFQSNDFIILSATSAEDALEIYKANLNIHLIISDSHMKKMSGIDFLNILVSEYKTIPYFYLATGDVDQSDASIIALGGHGVLQKPFDIDSTIIKFKTMLKF